MRPGTAQSAAVLSRKRIGGFSALIAVALMPLLPALAPTPAWAKPVQKQRKPSAVEGTFGAKLPMILELARELLTRRQVREFLRETFKEELAAGYREAQELEGGTAPRTRDVTETQFLLLLNENQDLIPALQEYIKAVPRTAAADQFTEQRQEWRARFRQLIRDRDIKKRFIRLANPLQPLELNNPDGSPGYEDPVLYVNHPWKKNGVSQPPADLRQLWIDLIRRARREVIVNVFDFDLLEVADALIERHRAGVQVSVGIDRGVIQARPQVKAVFDRLKQAGVFVHPVHSVGLNHPKLMAIDWSDAANARVLLSSGNLTQSCSGPEGDLKDVDPRPKESIPNANHALVLRSQILAHVIQHEISKATAPGLQLRGAEYPLSGTYKLYGPLPARRGAARSHLLIAFSPNGAFNSVNKHFIAKVIRGSRGPVSMAQFAFSSRTIEQALYDRAVEERRIGRRLEFISVGDTPFAMQDWSAFLRMSGMELQRSGTTKRYLEPADSQWRKLLGEAGLATFRRGIRIAPRIYGNRRLRIGDRTYDVSAKIHHKVLVTGRPGNRVAVTGSFNFSSGAESNQEYIVALYDNDLAEAIHGFVESLWSETSVSVYSEARRRNGSGEVEDPVDPREIESPERVRTERNQLESVPAEAATEAPVEVQGAPLTEPAEGP